MARSAGEIVIDGREVMSSITIGVRMPRCFALRMTLATWLFYLGGWVSGFNVVVEVDGEGETTTSAR